VTAAELCRHLRAEAPSAKARATESELQRWMAARLGRIEGFTCNLEREVELAPGDRIDFLLGGVGLELKVQGGPNEIARQLFRYSASARVLELVLFSTRATHAQRFPSELGGKPLYVVVAEPLL
jgi:hypothetical protein